MENLKTKQNKWALIKNEYIGKCTVTLCGLFIIALTVLMGAFLLYKGSQLFIVNGRSVFELLFSSEWAPLDSPTQTGGPIGAAIYITGSLITCGLALLIATPFSIAAAIFMSEISPKAGTRIFQPAVEIFVGIPSVVYGWVGLSILVPFIRDTFNAPMGGYSVLAAGIVLAIMIFPTITTVSSDAMKSVPADYRSAAYGLGATRWQMIRDVVVPAAKPGVLTGIILGLARAFGEALAVAMVIGKTQAFPQGILYPTNNITGVIASNMGNTAQGGEYNLALWSLALLLFVISIGFIFAIHFISSREEKKNK